MALRPRTRLWIQDEKEKIIFGTGRVRILKAIDETGSMNKAARKLGMSYRTVWGKVHDTEDRLGFKLIETTVGSTRGGSRLTPEARLILDKFDKWHDKTIDYADKLFAKLFEGAAPKKRTH
jgi:molybdate transport system regulatory protein